MVHVDEVSAMAEISPVGPKRHTTSGRPKGALNKITRDIRAALRDLAEANADRVQGWLDRVAESDPAKATRLWLALCRFVTPTLQAASITELTKPRSVQERLWAMSEADLMACILAEAPPAAALIECKPERDPILD